MARPKVRGIFCLEGDWWNDLNRTSTVKPILKLLSQGATYAVPSIHRDVGTVEELHHYLGKWRQQGYKSYPILYLAFHGEPGVICVGDQRRVGSKIDLDMLAEQLGDKLRGRIVHFGGCETLSGDVRHAKRFLKKTGAAAVTGYKRAVDWLSSAAFEVLLFEVMLRREINVAAARRIERELKKEIPHLLRAHDFRMVVREGSR